MVYKFTLHTYFSRCSNHKVVCLGEPCTTTAATTTTEMVTTPVPVIVNDHDCVPGWSNWFSNSSPKKGSISSDREPLDLPQRTGFTCGREHIVDIKCRTVGAHLDFRDTNQEVTCDAERGLICNGTLQKPCSDYEIQVKCDCSPPPSKLIFHLYLILSYKERS
jgi:Mucin-2 protein WxxW repeating region